MARACGIRIGARRFELFVLDGSPKKPKVVSAISAEYSPNEDPFTAAATALKDVLKQHNVPRDNIGIAIDARHAAFRRLQLPVSDPAKIEQVIKFEIEGQLPQFNIDDVVVDFLVLDSTPAESSLLVTAVPKEGIQRVLDLCSAAGFEPMEIELESTAMINSAVASGLCTVDTAQVLVHIGEESTAVAIVDGTKVREMRAIQIGALTGRPEPRLEDDLAEGAEGDRAPAEEPAEEDEAQRRMEIVGRIRRELSRSVSGARTANEIDGIHVCGFHLPELEAGEVLGHPVQVMEGFETEEESSGDGVGQYGSAAVAYGTALRQLGGGVLRPRLRREDLRFSGAMERLELPLAVVALLLVTFLGVFNIFVQKDRELVDVRLALWRDSSNEFMYPDPNEGKKAKLSFPSDKIANYVKMLRPLPDENGVDRVQDDSDRNRLEQLTWIRQMLRNEVSALEKELGRDGEILQPQSALKGLTLLLDVFESNQDVIRRPSIRQIRGTYEKGSARSPERVRVSLDITFFGESTVEATRDFEKFKELVKQAPWFLDFEDKSSEPLEGGASEGIHKKGLSIELDLTRAES